MTLPEAQWSKDNPRPIPRIYVPFKERALRIVLKATQKHKEQLEKEKPNLGHK